MKYAIWFQVVPLADYFLRYWPVVDINESLVSMYHHCNSQFVKVLLTSWRHSCNCRLWYNRIDHCFIRYIAMSDISSFK